MPARSIAFVIPVLVLAQAAAAHAQDSMACDAKQLCSKNTACVAGGSIVGNTRPGDVSGMMSWHSDVFRQDIPGLSRDNLDETGASIWMRRGGRAE
jgi:hypothetical protein